MNDVYSSTTSTSSSSFSFLFFPNETSKNRFRRLATAARTHTQAHIAAVLHQLQMHRCQARLVFICCSRLTQDDSANEKQEWKKKHFKNDNQKKRAHRVHTFSAFAKVIGAILSRVEANYSSVADVLVKCSMKMRCQFYYLMHRCRFCH